MTLDSGVRRLERSQLAAYRLAADLAAVPEPERLRVVGEDRRYQIEPFVELAVAFCREPGDSAIYWGMVAITAAGKSEEAAVREHLALAWATLGNTHRVAGDLRRAQLCIVRAEELVDEVADPLERADVLSLCASYWSDRCDYDGAQQRLTEAMQLCLDFSDQRRLTKLMTKMSTVAGNAEEWRGAAYWSARALERADVREDPRLMLVAGQNSALALVGLQQCDAASEVLWTLDPLYSDHGTPKLRLQRAWIEARSDAGRGAVGLAMAKLRALAKDAIEVSLHSAALITLDLAEMQVRDGLLREAEKTLAVVARTLGALGSPSEALRALVDLREAVASRQAPAVVLRLTAEARRLVGWG